MKLRSLFPFLLLALLALAGTAMAIDADRLETDAPVEQPTVDPVEPETQTLPELPLELQPERTEVDGCCAVECADERAACLDACGGDLTCEQACNADFYQCRTSC